MLRPRGDMAYAFQGDITRDSSSHWWLFDPPVFEWFPPGRVSQYGNWQAISIFFHVYWWLSTKCKSQTGAVNCPIPVWAFQCLTHKKYSLFPLIQSLTCQKCLAGDSRWHGEGGECLVNIKYIIPKTDLRQNILTINVNVFPTGVSVIFRLSS